MDHCIVLQNWKDASLKVCVSSHVEFICADVCYGYTVPALRWLPWSPSTLPPALDAPCGLHSYQVDMDLKKVVDESALKASRPDVKKAVKKIFEERYSSQKDVKSEKKATGVKYFFEKLRF